VQRAGDRRRTQGQDVDLEAQRSQKLLLRDTEALLLVQNDEAELLRDHIAAEDPVRPDQDVHLALLEVGQHLLDLPRGTEARDHLDTHGEVAVARAEGVPVLLREDRRRREHQRLLAVDRDGERGADRDLRLAEADVAADEPVHRTRRLEILLHRLDRSLLVRRLSVRELGLQPFEPLMAQVKRDAWSLLPLRVERKQLARELAHRLARAVLEVVPRFPAELRQRRHRVVGADVARDLPELLVRDVQAVVAAEAEEEVVARDAGDLFRLEAEQLADAVILVHDVVARTQVGEGLQRPATHAPVARRPLAEDLRVGKQDEAEVAPDEAAARGRDREEQLRLVREFLAGCKQTGVDAAEEILLAQGFAQVREGDDDALARAYECTQLVLRLGEPPRHERGSLRLERERLAGR